MLRVRKFATHGIGENRRFLVWEEDLIEMNVAIGITIPLLNS